MKNFFPGKSFSYGRKFISKIPFKKKKNKKEPEIRHILLQLSQGGSEMDLLHSHP